MAHSTRHISPRFQSLVTWSISLAHSIGIVSFHSKKWMECKVEEAAIYCSVISNFNLLGEKKNVTFKTSIYIQAPKNYGCAISYSFGIIHQNSKFLKRWIKRSTQENIYLNYMFEDEMFLQLSLNASCCWFFENFKSIIWNEYLEM